MQLQYTRTFLVFIHRIHTNVISYQSILRCQGMIFLTFIYYLQRSGPAPGMIKTHLLSNVPWIRPPGTRSGKPPFQWCNLPRPVTPRKQFLLQPCQSRSAASAMWKFPCHGSGPAMSILPIKAGLPEWLRKKKSLYCWHYKSLEKCVLDVFKFPKRIDEKTFRHLRLLRIR